MACHDIMIIEDEPGIRETLKDLLEMEGFHVFAAENGRTGINMLNEIGKPCLILLDLMMPVMNGWEFLEALKTQYQDVLGTVPVTVLSAAADVANVQQQYGCEVLKKPVNLERLVSIVHQHCQSC